MKLLLIDDDPDLVLLASVALEKLGGFEVVTSDGGPGAVELARCQRPDVILMDYMMPEIDGDELLRILHGEPDLAATPVIFLTGKDEPDVHAKLVAAGAVGVIVKPIELQQLASQVRELLAVPEES